MATRQWDNCALYKKLINCPTRCRIVQHQTELYELRRQTNRTIPAHSHNIQLLDTSNYWKRDLPNLTQTQTN